jgi:hypothetical protein
MTRTATISLCLVIAAAVAFRLLQLSQRARQAPAVEIATDSLDGAVVLPVVSSNWSKLTRQPVAARALTNAGETSTVAVAEVPSLNSEAIASRTRELLAQSAIASVGLDPEADHYWLAAINDSTLPAGERQELILALVEAGFADPRRVTANDLPLIAGRIALIEELAAHPMDAVNAAAFDETYRDLLAMFVAVTGPEPANATEETSVQGTGE